MSIEPRVYVTNDKKIPAQMSGDAGKSLIVNPTEDGYEHQVVGAVTNLTGQVIMWPQNVPPSGYLVCDNAEYSAAQYPGLAAILPESSPGNFRVPNIVFPKNSFGSGTLTEEVESVGTHDHDADAIPDHSHVLTVNSVGNHNHTISNEVLAGGTYWKIGSGTPAGEVTTVSPQVTATTSSKGAHGHTADAANAGGVTPVINQHIGINQPACTLLTFCIKT